MTNVQDKYLAQMLEGYEKGLTNIDEFIEQHETQIEEAKTRRAEIVASVDELKSLLNLSEEVDAAECP
jgi:hypothetical protein